MSVEERILDSGYENVIVFANDDFEDALIGISDDNRAIYDFDLMVEWLMKQDNMDETEAVEFIEYNTIRALPYVGDGAPIIMYKLY